MGQRASRASSSALVAAGGGGAPPSTAPTSSSSPPPPAGPLSQVLGLVDSPDGDDEDGAGRLQQHRKPSSSSSSEQFSGWQLEVLRQTKSIHRLTVISYEDFLENIRQLNEISGHYLDENGKQLVFAVKKGTDSTILWRATVRIACVKLDAETKKIESCRTLSLKQFIGVYNKLRHQADAVIDDTHKPPSVDDAASSPLGDVLEEIDGASRSSPSSASAVDKSEECVICLERIPELILPCAHSYCLPCIEQWSVNNKTCPVCRETVEDIDEGWVVSEGPDSLEIATEIQKSLMSLSH